MAVMDSTRLWAGRAFSKLIRNARNRNILVSITREDIDALIREQDMRCALTGIRLDISARGADVTSRCRPYFPSVDRIDAAGDYTNDNIRIVCVAVNYALCDWGKDVFGLIALGLCERKGWSSKAAPRARPKGVIARSEQGAVIYEALITFDKRRYYLGRFQDAETAGNYVRVVEAATGAGQSIGQFLPKARRNPSHQDRHQILGKFRYPLYETGADAQEILSPLCLPVSPPGP